MGGSLFQSREEEGSRLSAGQGNGLGRQAEHVARFPSHQSELLGPPVCPEAPEVICSRHAGGGGIVHDHDMGPGGRGREGGHFRKWTKRWTEFILATMML